MPNCRNKDNCHVNAYLHTVLKSWYCWRRSCLQQWLPWWFSSDAKKIYFSRWCLQLVPSSSPRNPSLNFSRQWRQRYEAQQHQGQRQPQQVAGKHSDGETWWWKQTPPINVRRMIWIYCNWCVGCGSGATGTTPNIFKSKQSDEKEEILHDGRDGVTGRKWCSAAEAKLTAEVCQAMQGSNIQDPYISSTHCWTDMTHTNGPYVALW